MPRRPPVGGDPDDEVLRRFREKITGKGSAELSAVGRQLMDLAEARASLEPMPSESRRRPPRDDEAIYRVTVDLDDAASPVWRRLELLSTIRLDELHDVLQVAFGWTDSHLHRFALGRSVWDRDAEVFLCPYDVEEGDTDGVPEQEVRLDEVLGEPGDVLRYEYDYGDSWALTIRLDVVVEQGEGAARAACTGGQGVAPPDDSGGILAWNETRGDDPDGSLGRFEPADVDAVLQDGNQLRAALACGPAILRRLLARTWGTPAHDVVVDLVLTAGLNLPVEVDATDVEEVVRPYRWLLDRVGEQGITLTSDGYLPPSHVLAAMTELFADEPSSGARVCESYVGPVRDLRLSARARGLVRTYKGRLVLTKTGRRLRHDPVALWRHLASGLLSTREDSDTYHAGVLCLLAVAGGRDIDSPVLREQTAGVLTQLGWHYRDGTAIDPMAPIPVWWSTQAGLRALGAFMPVRTRWRSSPPSPNGRLMAREALRRGA